MLSIALSYIVSILPELTSLQYILVENVQGMSLPLKLIIKK